MQGIPRVNTQFGALQQKDPHTVNQRKSHNKNGSSMKKVHKSTASHTAGNPLVDEMKIVLKKEGLGSFIDMMA